MDLEPQGPSSAEPVRALGEDTIEIELTSAQQSQLASAAAYADAPEATATSQPASAEPDGDDSVYRRAARVDSISNATLAAAVIVVAGALLWRAANLHAHVALPLMHPLVTAAHPAPAHGVPPPAPPPLVRETNPFDASEVFEFPADTPESQARGAMAALLMQRARERLAQGLDLRHEHDRHQPRVAMHEPAEIFVTRLSASVN
jgi:hypothetical protein